MLLLTLSRKKFVAMAIAISFGVMLFVYLGKIEERAMSDRLVPVPVLVEDVAEGTLITPDLIETSLVSLAELPERWIDCIEAIGKTLKEDLPMGTVLTWDYLENSSAVAELSEESAKSIEWDKSFVLTVSWQEAAALNPGDYIDLIGVFASRNNRGEQSVLLAEQVCVIGISDKVSHQEFDTYSWSDISSATITIGVDETSAHRLALAEEFGKIRVIKRESTSNKASTRLIASGGVTLDSILSEDLQVVEKPRSGWPFRGGENSVAPSESLSRIKIIKGTKIVHPSLP